MDFFLARQPILNQHKRLYAYELLYRGTRSSNLSNTSGNKATTSVLSSAFLTEGIEKISESKPCFINFTKDLLLQNLPASFPKSLVVVEILEDVPPTPEIIAICQALKQDGYTIALDDFIYDKSLEPLISIADIIKFDFRLTPVDAIDKALYKLRGHKLKFLAEKVETDEEFIKASNMGFSFFQGYFFCKPESIKIKEVDSAKINLVNLLSEVSQAKTTLKKIQDIIERDVALAYKLLRYVNSSYFYRVSKIDSVAQAIAYLGENELRRYIILILVSELAADKPSELLRLALVRAEMCRLLAKESRLSDKADEIFLLGLFSLLDAMLDTSMEDVCGQLSLGNNITNGLMNNTGPYASFLAGVIYYERGNGGKCISNMEKLGITVDDKLHQIYLEAISFAASAFD